MKNLRYVALLLTLSSCFVCCKQNTASKTISNITSQSKIQESESKEENKIPNSSSTNSNFEFTNESFGCESFTVYKFNEDKTIALWVNGENEALKLSKSPQTFTLGKEDKIYAALYQFDANGEKYFCDDIGDDNPNVINRWAATQGKVTAYITEEAKTNETIYRMTLLIESVLLKDKKNETVELKNIRFENVSVGRFSG